MTRWTMLDTDLTTGELRLLHDLVVVACLTGSGPVPARTRLDRELGPDFADVVRSSLLETMPQAA
jgi:hypothetical protein